MDKSTDTFQSQIEVFKDLNETKSHLLEHKRHEIYTFFSSTKSLIFLIVMVLSFLVTLYSVGSEINPQSLRFASILQDLVTIAITALVPISLFMIYFGSVKKQNQTLVKGLNLAGIYFLILKILLIIVTAVAVVMFFLMLSRLSFGLFFAMVFFAIGLIIAFYMISIFKDFLQKLKTSFNAPLSNVPSSRNIVNYLFVMFIFTFIIYLIVLIFYNGISSSIVDYATALGYTPTEVAGLDELLNILKVGLYFSVALYIILEVFIIYYFNSFDKTFISYNQSMKEKIRQIRDQELKEKTTK